MAVTVWKGHLTFGLVSIPVRLVRAARHETVGFHQLYRAEPVPTQTAAPPRNYSREDHEDKDGDDQIEADPTPTPVTRVQQAAFVPEAQTQAPIPRENLVKGYEYEKNRYVVIEKEDLEKITPKTATEMQILEFVRISEIDPIHFETSYYVTPEQAGEKPYALLFDALRQSGYVALAEFAMRRRQHAVVIRPGKTGIIAHTMYYADEIRKIDEFRTNTQLVTTKERDLAVSLIEAMAASVPVVQPRTAAFPEILEATGGGVLCEPNDAKALADAIEELMLNPARASALGEAGRKSVTENFNAETMARRTLDVFTNAVGPK